MDTIKLYNESGTYLEELSPEYDPIKDTIIDRTLNGPSTLKFSLYIDCDKWEHLVKGTRLRVDNKEFIIDTDGSVEQTRDQKGTIWGSVKAGESWSELGHKRGNYLSVSLLSVNAAYVLEYLLEGLEYEDPDDPTQLPWQDPGWHKGTVTMPSEDFWDLETEKKSCLENLWDAQKIWGGVLLFDSIDKLVHWYRVEDVGSDTGLELKYAYNNKTITKRVNNDIVTRLYVYGYEDLDIRSVNNGIPYVENFSYTTEVIEDIMSFGDIDEPEKLMARGEEELAKICKPRVTYSTEFIDLSTLPYYSPTVIEYDIGDRCRVVDEGLNTNEIVRINKLSYHVFEPWKVSVECGDPAENIESLISGLTRGDGVARRKADQIANLMSGLLAGTGWIKAYPNKCFNSSFESFNPATLKPDYWDTSGVVSPDAEFDETYSLKIDPGGYAMQATIEGEGLVDPKWWAAWCTSTRVTLRVKGPTEGSKIRVSIYRYNSGAEGLYNRYPLECWYKPKTSKKEKLLYTTEPHWFEFNVPTDWHQEIFLEGGTSASLISVAFHEEKMPECNGLIRLRLDVPSDSAGSIYVDSVIIEPDWTGHWPAFYTHGPFSGVTYTRARVGGRNIWVQNTAPTAFDIGDLWVDTST